jgi:hypothetical protein
LTSFFTCFICLYGNYKFPTFKIPHQYVLSAPHTKWVPHQLSLPLFSSVIGLGNLQVSWHHVGIFLLNSTYRVAAKGNVVCPSTDQPTYILYPDTGASSPFPGPPPVPDGQSIRGLIIEICFCPP